MLAYAYPIIFNYIIKYLFLFYLKFYTFIENKKHSK